MSITCNTVKLLGQLYLLLVLLEDVKLVSQLLTRLKKCASLYF